NIQGYGVVPGSTSLGPLGSLRVPNGQIAAQASTRLGYSGNLSADWQAPPVATFSPVDPQSYNSSIVSVVYDSLGAQHTVTQYFVKSGTNQIDTHYSFDGNPVPTVSTLQFATNGQLTAPVGTTPLALPAVAGAAPLALGIDYAGTTQFAGDATTTANAADGYASGSLVSVQIGSDGAVEAQYSNGQKQRVGTVALATFAAESGLVPVDNTSWVASSDSGLPLIAQPGAGQVGELVSGALEQSNVDITHELVDLMGAQRNYQANTKVLSTENEMMQTLMQAL
ncbi:MAG TPA: flagellar hook-basal body complex protein, partial [Rhizobacter sp.]|nr:flagellar hook-basal body complex protein [Rhizobacter sp.]